MTSLLLFLDKDGSWLLKVDIFTEVPAGVTAKGQIEVKLANTTVTQATPVTLTSVNNKATLNISIPKVRNECYEMY